jgi:hypothetical protein
MLPSRYNPACQGVDDVALTQAVNRRRAAYWDAAEKYYSVCQFGRTSVSNGVGQYNPNVKVEGGSTKPFTTNPDAIYSNLYNIHYSHNSGLSSGYAALPFAPSSAADPAQQLYFASTYNPESFPSEVQFLMHPLQAASFPMCIARGTSTPSGVVSASVLDGLNVLLPLRCDAVCPLAQMSHAIAAEFLLKPPARFFTTRSSGLKRMLSPQAPLSSHQPRQASHQSPQARSLDGRSTAA